MSAGGLQPYTHRLLVNVYFYIVKYMLGEAWSEPIGMSCGARMTDKLGVSQCPVRTYSQFECIIGKENKGMSGR